MTKTLLSVLLGLSLTACEPMSSVHGTIQVPPEAVGKPLIVHVVASQRLGAHGLPDPYQVLSLGTESAPFSEVSGTSEPYRDEGMGCPDTRVVAWVDMNGSEGITRRDGQLVAPEGWNPRAARPDEGDWVASSEELDYHGMYCTGGDYTVDLKLEPYRP